MAARRGVPQSANISIKQGANWTTGSTKAAYRDQWVIMELDHGIWRSGDGRQARIARVDAVLALDVLRAHLEECPPARRARRR